MKYIKLNDVGDQESRIVNMMSVQDPTRSEETVEATITRPGTGR